jgi:UDP-2,4-diacetamido-2,4,6-trideoxy-beta-L-altropyranose hydrolase
MKIRIRLADEMDCLDVWLWRNHVKARNFSFNKKGIDYKKHTKWFLEIMSDERAKIYIAENKKKEKIAQIRFTLYNTYTSYISISLNPNYYGKGLGSKIIERATSHYLTENPYVREVRAEVLEENLASKRAFEKAGYFLFHNEVKLDANINVLCHKIK